jgi:hypothetical protein
MRSKIGWLSTADVAQMAGLERRVVTLLCRDGWLTPARKVRGIWFIDPMYEIVLPDFYLYPGDKERQGERPVYETGKVYKYKRRKIPPPWSKKMRSRRKRIKTIQQMLHEEEQRIIEREGA